MKAARSAYRRSAKASGNDPDIIVEFAVFEAGNSRYDLALRLLDQARTSRPDDPAIALNQGEVARLAGDHQAAARHFRRALSLAPDDPDALLGWGEASIVLGNHADAAPALGRAAAIAPRDPDIAAALGRARQGLGLHAEASESFGHAVRLAPEMRHAWIGAGQCQLILGRHREAAASLTRAHSLEPLHQDLLIALARALLDAGEHEAALGHAETAIGRDPDRPEGYQICGACLQHLGRFDEAEACLRRAIGADPRSTEAYEGLGAMSRLMDADARALRMLLEDAGDLSPSRRASGWFALYRALDRAGDHAGAFAALTSANDLVSVTEPFDTGRHMQVIDDMIAAFGRRFFDRLRPISWDPGFRPIFIVGLPRSGTTLAEQILSHFRDVHPGGERVPFRAVLEDAIDDPSRVAAAPTEWIDQQARAIAAHLADGAAGARFVTDKTPGNYMAFPFIVRMFPNARIVRCVRDPRDVGFSCYEQHFRAGVSFAYSLEAFACAHQGYEKIWTHWRNCCDAPVHELSYEDLVRAPEATARELVEFCGLDWDPACLDVAASDRVVRTSSFWQVRQPINDRSVGKWRRYEPYLGGFLEMLGPVDTP